MPWNAKAHIITCFQIRFPSLSYTNTQSHRITHRELYTSNDTCMKTCPNYLSLSVCLSVCLCVSLSNTHTHTPNQPYITSVARRLKAIMSHTPVFIKATSSPQGGMRTHGPVTPAAPGPLTEHGCVPWACMNMCV